jgi:hypothetical protein
MANPEPPQSTHILTELTTKMDEVLTKASAQT